MCIVYFHALIFSLSMFNPCFVPESTLNELNRDQLFILGPFLGFNFRIDFLIFWILNSFVSI